MQSSTNAPKAELRRLFLSLRDDLGVDARAALSAAVCAHLLARHDVAGGPEVLVYLPMRGEVDLGAVVGARLAAGRAVSLPHTNWETGQLEPVRLRALAEVVTGRFGVPDLPAGQLEAVAADSVTAVLVPGLAFDRSGYRLGYGAGFYDRLLPRLAPGCLVVGVAFGAQLVDALPHEDHDRPVSALVTEQGWLEVPGG